MEEKKARDFIGIMFDCCGIYSRIYKNKQGTAYVGWCPKCMKKIELKIGEGGSDNRIFRARGIFDNTDLQIRERLGY